MTLQGSSLEERLKQQATVDSYMNDLNHAHIPWRSFPMFEDLSKLAAAVALVGALGTTTQRSPNPPVTLEVGIRRPILYSPTLSPLNYSPPRIVPLLQHSGGSIHKIPLPDLPSSGRPENKKDPTVPSYIKQLAMKKVARNGAKHTYKNRNRPQRPQPMAPPPPLPNLKPWQKVRSSRK